MRIAHTILSRGFAGSERATAEMCNAHVGTHDVQLIVRRNDVGHGGVALREWVDPAVELTRIRSVFQQRPMARALERFRPDVIHSHLRRSTRLLSRMDLPAPTIATLHLALDGREYLEMDGLICIAQWQARDIPDDYRGRVFFINESLIPNRRLAPEEIQALRSELGVGPDEYLVGSVGRLVHGKGYDVLIDAFHRAQLPDAKLVILGAGREQWRLQRQAGPWASLSGFRTNAKDYYQAFDLFVSPSRSEPLGRVVLEALDAGTPVVAAATLGPTEILSRYPGDLFPIGDAGALADLLHRHHMARTPRSRHDLSPYHIENVARETEAAYRVLIEGRSR